MYYRLDMSQGEIAARTFLSRPHVSRLLKQAREEGIVEIRLNYCGERCRYAETSLKSGFGLDAAHVYNFDGIPAQEVQNAICRHSAEHIESMLHMGQAVGITRGSIIAGIIRHFKPGRKLDLRIIQMIGAEAAATAPSAPDLVRKMADVFGGSTVYLDAPLYVENDFVRNSLIKEPFLRKKLNDVKGVQLVLTSIRPLHSGINSHVWSGFIDDRQANDLMDAGAVGYLLGRAFDIDGNILDHPVNRRIIGMDPMELRDRAVVGISYGKDHARAVLGALRGGFVKTIITDFNCANEILSLAAPRQGPGGDGFSQRDQQEKQAWQRQTSRK